MARKRKKVVDLKHAASGNAVAGGPGELAPIADEHGCQLEKGYEPSGPFLFCLGLLVFVVLGLVPSLLLSEPVNEVPPYVQRVLNYRVTWTRPIPHIRKKGDPKWMIWDSQVYKEQDSQMFLWTDGHVTWRDVTP